MSTRSAFLALTAGLCGLLLPATLPEAAGAAAESPPVADAPVADAATDDDGLPATLDIALHEWTGDFDGMVERGLIRVALPVGLSTYYMDGADQAGLSYEMVTQFERHVKKRLGKKGRTLTVAVLPARLDQLLDMLDQGRADIVAGRLTVTPERQARAAFSDPFRTDVDELVISAEGTAPAQGIDDLVGLPLHVRRSSSFWETLSRINAERDAAGKALLTVIPADERLRIEDLMELVGTGAMPATVADSTVAEMFATFFPKAVVHRDAPLAEGQSYGWAFRKDDPKLAEAVNGFVKTARKGTRLGNVITNKYTKNTRWITNATEAAETKKYREMSDLFQAVAGKYAFDWLLVIAQGYQESGLNQAMRSPVGAIGVMQVMPATARDPAVGIPDIHILENNVHAGVKYMDHLREAYLAGPELAEPERTYFSFAAYNAGPGNLSKARKRAVKLKLDPDIWFDNVEIAMAQSVSREPVVYVRNILKYYTAYKLSEAVDASHARARDGTGAASGPDAPPAD